MLRPAGDSLDSSRVVREHEVEQLPCGLVSVMGGKWTTCRPMADDTLPQRILKDAAKTGAGKGRVSELSVMLPEYYELRGWDKKGVPKKATLKRLDLA